jgi:hypothetical protein
VSVPLTQRLEASAKHWLVPGLLAAGAVLAGCGGSSSSTRSSGQPGALPPAAARFVLGRWHGELHQRGLAPFRITVTVASLATSEPNTVHYTGLNCGGDWTYLGTSGAAVHFREVIDTGNSSTCKGVGEVTVSREAARLRYQFSGGGVVSRGLLSRG